MRFMWTRKRRAYARTYAALAEESARQLREGLTDEDPYAGAEQSRLWSALGRVLRSVWARLSLRRGLRVRGCHLRGCSAPLACRMRNRHGLPAARADHSTQQPTCIRRFRGNARA
jgi:hypothetical protein